VDAHDRDVIRTGVLLDDLVRDPHQGAAKIVAIEHDLLKVFFQNAPLPGLSDRVKGTDGTSLPAASPEPGKGASSFPQCARRLVKTWDRVG
jgi:hypothetical protein